MLLLLSTIACYQITYTTSIEHGVAPDEEYWNHRLIYGIVEMEGPLKIQDICEGGEFAKIKTEIDEITGLVSYLVNGQPVNGFLYSPDMIYVWCADGNTYRAQTRGEAVVVLEAPLGQQVPQRLGQPESCAQD